MSRADPFDHVHQALGFPKRECAELVELTFDIIKESLERGENVKMSGFGNFVVRQKRASRGRNPQTGEDTEIAPRKVLTFKPSLVLKEAINGGP